MSLRPNATDAVESLALEIEELKGELVGGDWGDEIDRPLAATAEQ